MEGPHEDLTSDADERPLDFDALASFDELVRGDRTRDDSLEAVLALDTPATGDEVAPLADHGADAARESLVWFERKERPVLRGAEKRACPDSWSGCPFTIADIDRKEGWRGLQNECVK